MFGDYFLDDTDSWSSEYSKWKVNQVYRFVSSAASGRTGRPFISQQRFR